MVEFLLANLCVYVQMKMRLKGRGIGAREKGFESDERGAIVTLLNSAAGICTESAQERNRAGDR